MIRGRKSVVTQLGRETSLERIAWDQNGWPIANGGKGPLDANIRPVLPWTPVFNPSSDEFSDKQLGIQWIFRRNPVFENFSLTEKNGFLRIYSGNYDIDTIPGRNLIVQRERWLKYIATTKLTFNPSGREQAGITAHYDTKTYARLGLQKSDNGRLQLVLEERRYGNKSILNVIQDIKKNASTCRSDSLTQHFFSFFFSKTW